MRKVLLINPPFNIIKENTEDDYTDTDNLDAGDFFEK